VRRLAIAALCGALGCSSAPVQWTRIEIGAFALHKFEQRIGEERFTIEPDPEGPAGAVDSTLAKIDFQFVDRQGWIVGYGVVHNATHGFLIRPR
jgi:hypothetical protein